MAREFQAGDKVKFTGWTNLTGFHTGVNPIDTLMNTVPNADKVGRVLAKVDCVGTYTYYNVELLSGEILRYIPDYQLTLLENL